MLKANFLKGVALLISVLINTAYATPSSLAEIQTANYFSTIQQDAEKLEQFLYALPKGADLHSHVSGASLPENLIHYALNDGLCVNRDTYTVYQNSQCDPLNRLAYAEEDDVLKDAIIDAWSMQHFVGGRESGHDHFFAAFGKFGLITWKHRPEIMTEVIERAASQNEVYLELMLTPDGNAFGKLGKQIAYDQNFANMHRALLAMPLQTIIHDAIESLNNDEKQVKAHLHCDTESENPACQMKVRYQYQVYRNQSPNMVFAQLLGAFELAKQDKRIVGINMVQAEDATVSIKDYKLHMQMIRYFREHYPTIHVSLHAGELSRQFTTEDALHDHIHDAVQIAKADRIGHGVDILNEDNADKLLNEMAQKQILVEINLSSNADILEIEGSQHPLSTYMRYNVPVSLSTDDEGITRSNLTHEYLRAVQYYQFDYFTLKMLSRNSLYYAFLPGQNLWEDHSYQTVHSACKLDPLGSFHPSVKCQIFLAQNEKAASQWELERRFSLFEEKYLF